MEDAPSTAERLYRDALLPALQRLDRLLQQAVAAAQAAYGPEAVTDRFRGLYISPDEVVRLFAQHPGEPALHGEEPSGEALLEVVDEPSGIAALARTFDLAAFDLDVLLMALAPELDLRYERLYAYLQDDVSRKRPSVDLALNLLCPSAGAKLERRTHFAAGAPLIRHSLLHLISDSGQVQPPLLAHTIKLDDQVVRFLLGESGLDRRLAPFCQWVEPTDVPDLQVWDAERQQALEGMVRQAGGVGGPLRLYFHGPPGAGRRDVVATLARAIGAPLLVADLARAHTSRTDFEQYLRLLFREARFQEAILYLDGLDGLRNPEHDLSYQALLHALAEDPGVTILGGTQPWTPTGRDPLGVLSVPFPVPDFPQRRTCWQGTLAAAGITVDAEDLDALAGRFRLAPGQIAEAVATARSRAGWRRAAEGPTRDDLFTAARAQSGHDLAALAHKIEPTYTWGDIVLPDDTVAQLREICQRVAHRHRVLGEWGFARQLSMGTGTNALFAGPTGTGKTMAAEIIAGALGLDLYRIDLSGVVSKYIGETEKNLDRVFRAAENANAVLFFDEADALFGKRSEVRDAHDRYANIEISYLLQKMEEYEGLAILATNLRQNLDDAFTRRLAFTVYFPFPDEADRRRIWQGIWPAQTPRAGDVDLDLLASRFKLSGGNIKNVALAAAFLAAEDGGPVTMAHLLRATRREYQKMGKILTEAELNGIQTAVASATGKTP